MRSSGLRGPNAREDRARALDPAGDERAVPPDAFRPNAADDDRTRVRVEVVDADRGDVARRSSRSRVAGSNDPLTATPTPSNTSLAADGSSTKLLEPVAGSDPGSRSGSLCAKPRCGITRSQLDDRDRDRRGGGRRREPQRRRGARRRLPLRACRCARPYSERSGLRHGFARHHRKPGEEHREHRREHVVGTSSGSRICASAKPSAIA